MIFSQIKLGGTSWHMKPISVILLFSADLEILSNMWNFDCNTCLVK